MYFQPTPAQQEQQLLNQYDAQHEQLVSQVTLTPRTYLQAADMLILLTNWYNTLQTYYLPQAVSLNNQGCRRLLPKVQEEIGAVSNGIALYRNTLDVAIAPQQQSAFPQQQPAFPPSSAFDDWLADQNRRTERAIATTLGNCVLCGYDLRGVPRGVPCPKCGRLQN